MHQDLMMGALNLFSWLFGRSLKEIQDGLCVLMFDERSLARFYGIRVRWDNDI
jgi:hypothetical protein